MCTSASTSTVRPCVARGRGGDRTDARDDRRHRVGADRLDEAVDGGRRREGDDVGARDGGALLVGDGGGHGAVGVDDVDRPAARAQPVGQHVARHLGPREQHPPRRPGARQGVEQRLGDEPLGHEVGAHAAGGQHGGGGRTDGRHAGGAEGAGVEARRRASAAEQPLGAVRRRDDDPVVGRRAGAPPIRSAAPPSAGSAISITGTSIGSAPASRSARDSADACGARPGHDDAAPEQRSALEPGQVDGGDLADDDHRRGGQRRRADRREGGADRLLLRAGAPPHRGHRGVGVEPAGDQLLGDPADAGDAHEDHDRAADLGDRVASRRCRRRRPPGPRGR